MSTLDENKPLSTEDVRETYAMAGEGADLRRVYWERWHAFDDWLAGVIADARSGPYVLSDFDPATWEVDRDEMGGQPNGAGEIEPSDYREWFDDMRESHHRIVITLTGPWEEGPTESARRVQEAAARHFARNKELKERNERAEYERLRAKFEAPEEAES